MRFDGVPVWKPSRDVVAASFPEPLRRGVMAG